MKKVYVEKNKVVVEFVGHRAIYDLPSIEKRIKMLEQNLEEWRSYQRLLTPDAADGALWRCSKCGAENPHGYSICAVCGKTPRR